MFDSLFPLSFLSKVLFVTRFLFVLFCVCAFFSTSAYLAAVIAFVTTGIILLTKLKYL